LTILQIIKVCQNFVKVRRLLLCISWMQL
jgi:hypothetical protein